MTDEEIRARFDEHGEGIWFDSTGKWFFAWRGTKYGPFDSQQTAEIHLESEIEEARRAG